MSIIVAVSKNDRTVVAADTLTCFGDSHCTPPEMSTTVKAYRLGASVLGATGWAVYDDIIRDYLHDQPAPDLDSNQAIFTFFMEFWKVLHDRYPFVNDQSRDKETPFGDLDTSFLLANRGGIFKVSSDMGVTKFDRYYAIGSGSEFALGALNVLFERETDPESIARQAVHTAIQFDVHCGGEIDLLRVE